MDSSLNQSVSAPKRAFPRPLWPNLKASLTSRAQLLVPGRSLSKSVLPTQENCWPTKSNNSNTLLEVCLAQIRLEIWNCRDSGAEHLSKFCLARILVISVAEWLWSFFLQWSENVMLILAWWVAVLVAAAFRKHELRVVCHLCPLRSQLSAWSEVLKADATWTVLAWVECFETKSRRVPLVSA